MTVMTMSPGGMSRFDTLMRVQRGELRVMDAMALLGLARSQMFKLLARLRDEGPSGLIFRKRGRPSNRRCQRVPPNVPGTAQRAVCPPSPGRPRCASPIAPCDDVDAEMVWREERTVSKSLSIHFNKAIFIHDPTPAARSLAGKRVLICEYPDGRVEVRHNHRALPYTVFDKMRQVNQAEIVDSKRPGGGARHGPGHPGGEAAPPEAEQ